MFGLFKKKSGIELKAPLTGKIVPISEIPDEVFAQKMVGDGIGIDPTEGEVVSPVDGEVVQLFPTKHAIGIKTKDGLEILIHVGLDTVKMHGEGFEAFVKAGDQVTVGQKLLTFDLNLIREKAKSTITPFIITNVDAVDSIEPAAGTVTKGMDKAIEAKLK